MTRHDYLNIALIGIGLMLTYAWSMPRTITLEDAGLFQMTCQLGGIAHAPGYPLFTSLCQLVVPFFPGSVLPGNLLSAIFASTACMVLYSCLLHYRITSLAALSGSLACGFGAVMWAQATVIEVYTLAVLGYVICWRLLLQWISGGAERYLYIAAFVYGLCLANHWPLTVLSTPALLVVVATDTSRLIAALKNWHNWLICAVCLMAGLLPYLVLLQPNPAIALMGPLDSLEKLVSYVTRSVYESNENQVIAGWGDKFGFIGWQLKESAQQFGLLGGLLVVTGVVHVFLTRSKLLTIQLLLLYLGTTLVIVLLIDVSFEHVNRTVFQPWPVIAYLALACWLAFGTDYLLGKFRGKLALKGPVVAIVILSLFLSNLTANNRRDDSWVENYGRDLLESLPKDAVYLAVDEFELGVLGYLHKVQGVRPDIELRNPWNQFFDNRLVSPYATVEEQTLALSEHLGANSKPVFASSIVLYPQKLLGAYYEYTPGESGSVARNPKMDDALERLLEAYTRGQITDYSELHLAYQQLVGFTRQHISLALTGDIDEAGLARLNALQRTFPGRLATLEILVPRNQAAAKPVLFDLARAAAADIPEHAPRQSRAVLYEFLGRIELMAPAYPVNAIGYFERSLEINPVAGNRSICPLVGLYRNTGEPQKLVRLETVFGESIAACEHEQD